MNKKPPFISFAEARKIDSDKTVLIAEDPNAWKLKVVTPSRDVYTSPSGSDIEIEGFAGSIKVVVATDREGNPIYDKLLYVQKPGVAIVTWGIKDSVIYLAYLTQARPFANDTEQPDKMGSMIFGQIPMGFLSNS